MAIIVEKEKQGADWMPIMLAIFFAFITIVGTYFLFFAPVPFIERISSPELRTATQIAVITLDTREVIGSPVVSRLRAQVGLPPQGSFGRTNPFIPFNVVLPGQFPQ